MVGNIAFLMSRENLEGTLENQDRCNAYLKLKHKAENRVIFITLYKQYYALNR